jgi:hypothetical protein
MDIQGILQLGQQYGMSTLLFVFLIIYLRSNDRRWEEREKSTVQIYESIIRQNAESREKEFSLLQQALNDSREQLGMLRAVFERMKQMHQQSDKAFSDLFTKISHILQNRCVNHPNHPHK